MNQFLIDGIAREIQQDRMREAAHERLLREVGPARGRGGMLGPALMSLGRHLEALGARLGAESEDAAVTGELR